MTGRASRSNVPREAKLHAVTDTAGHPIRFFMTAGQVSDYTGTAALLADFPKAEWLLGDRGYDADWFREALKDKGLQPCIPGRKSSGKSVKYDKRRTTTLPQCPLCASLVR
ncbi:Transposase DDE domain-containing protein [Lutimaribacter saemankumensis]|uniref:Transposase DDE domain-containing protein n=1 Tax=Lutimaribacter saemankumensis TaxID=490829 RepID=A0A1G8RD50_9RHOB|nr:Transposase DDE domain-containing protein [Lutimaribacter saemankumensis]